MIVSLRSLLMGAPPYDEHLAEQVLTHYLRIFRRRVDELLARGCELEDVVQEMRITLWREWMRYDPERGYPLQTWLSYKLDYTLRELKKKAG